LHCLVEQNIEDDSSLSEVHVPPGMAAEDFKLYAAVDDLSTEADEISESDIVSPLQPSADQLTDKSAPHTKHCIN